TLDALLLEVKDRLKGKPRGRAQAVAAEIKRIKAERIAQCRPKLTSSATPLSPYRVINDLLHTVDPARTIITHDAGSPRDQISPFWECTEPLSYIGWGKTTQLGYGLGLAMGAKLAHPDKLCVNVWGDAAIGFTGMDFETAVRERIPILSVLLNNFSMGFGCLWSAEMKHDPFPPLAVAAVNTERLQLGTAIAVAFPRSPMVLAHTVWDLQKASGGRFALGLGTQVKAHNERRFAVRWEP